VVTRIRSVYDTREINDNGSVLTRKNMSGIPIEDKTIISICPTFRSRSSYMPFLQINNNVVE